MDEMKPVMCPWCTKPVVPRKYYSAYRIECPCGYRVTDSLEGMEFRRAQNPI